MKNRILFIIFSFFLACCNVNAWVESGSGIFESNAKSVGCSGGSGLCYTFASGAVGSPSSFGHIGIRISIVDKNGESTGMVQDYLPSKMIAQLNNLQAEGSKLLTFKINDGASTNYQSTKREITAIDTEWYTNLSAGNKIGLVNPNNISRSSLSWLFNTFDNIQAGSGDYGNAVFNQLLGSGSPSEQKLVKNYNAGTNIVEAVFNNGGGTDKGALDNIILELTGSTDLETTLTNLSTRNDKIQFEITTVVNVKIKSSRYLFYGTTAEIRAMIAQIAKQEYGVSKHSNIKYLFGDSGYIDRPYQALPHLNSNFYALEQLGSEIYGGDDGICADSYGNQYDWIEARYHNCGIGILNIRDLVILPPTPMCEVLATYEHPTSKNPDGTPLEVSPAYFDAGRNLLNDTVEASQLDQKFYESCGCEKTKEKLGESNAVYQRYCEAPVIPTTDVCALNITDKNCNSDGTEFTIGDDAACVFNVDKVGEDVSDDSGDASTDAKKYTYYKNDYCSLTCAEAITFKLPGEVNSVTAGKYWTWRTDMIELSGTRTCQATVDIAKFNTIIGSTYDSDESDDRLTKIYDIYNGEFIENTDDDYTLYEQLRDIAKAYSDYKRLNTSFMGDSDWCEEEDRWGNCVCDGYSYTDSTTGETFEYYEGGGCNSGLPTSGYTSTTSDIEASDLLDDFEDKYNEIKDEIEEAINNVNDCTEALREQTLSDGTTRVDMRYDDYDFEPAVAFKYDDPRYNDAFLGREYLEESSSTAIATDVVISGTAGLGNLSYKDDLSDASRTNHNYYLDPNNSVTYQTTNTYSSSVYFYIRYADFSKGMMSWEYSSAGMEDYTFGNNVYPISLKETGTKNYTLMFDNLGVDLNGRTTSGRFNRFLGNRDLEYVCEYNVTNDITIPEKPNYYFRTVSLNNFNPNNRTLGKNWDNPKAWKTLEEIDAAGTTDSPESIYEGEGEYHVVLTPENMKKIREDYNTSNNYSDFNMTAVDRATIYNEIGDITASTAQSVWFTSNFLDSAETNGYVKEFKRNSGSEFVSWSTFDRLTNTGPAWK